MNIESQVSPEVQRLKITLQWFNGREAGDCSPFLPVINGEEIVSTKDLISLVESMNFLHGKHVIAKSHGYIVSPPVRRKPDFPILTEEERESILDIFKGGNDNTTETVSAKPASSLAFRMNDNGTLVTPEISIFNGGEINLNIGKYPIPPWEVSSVRVYARLQDSDGVIALLLLKDALERHLGASKGIIYMLYLDYIPYARQDHVCNEGEALSIRVITDLINSMSFNQVIVTDPHSDVAPALLRDCEVATCSDVITSFTAILEAVEDGLITTLVSPNGGSIKKVEELGRQLSLPVVYGRTLRDIPTGKISGFSCPNEVKNMRLLIVDDICDEGDTFIGLGKILKEKGARSIDLYVTHGIFSQGLDELLEVFYNIYSTDSFNSGLVNSRLIIKPLFGK